MKVRDIIPGYGKKGMGLPHPKKAIYNQVYRRTSYNDVNKRMEFGVISFQIGIFELSETAGT